MVMYRIKGNLTRHEVQALHPELFSLFKELKSKETLGEVAKFAEKLTPKDYALLGIEHTESPQSSLLDKVPIKLQLDVSLVRHIDSAGAILLASFLKSAVKQNCKVEFIGMSKQVERTLKLLPMPLGDDLLVKPLKGPFREYVADLCLALFKICSIYINLLVDVWWFVGEILFSEWRRVRKKGADKAFLASPFRWSSLYYEMSHIGSKAIGVIGVIAFLLGVTMGLQGAAQLRRFGANIFVADLLSISIVREIGPLITAIVMAGRSGAAIASEIATMNITEEVSALKTMGIHPYKFILVPKVLAITFTQPLLTMMANMIALMGGFLVAITYLDVSPNAFISRVEQSIYLKDLLTGLLKSIVFANLIVTIAAFYGFNTEGGADAVGRSTTKSVVSSIFAVVAADGLASLLFYFKW